MASSDKNPVQSWYIKFLSTDDSWIHSTYTKIIGGAILAGLLVFIPLFYGGIDSVEQLSSLQLCLILLVMEICILLTVKLGDRFVDAIAKALGDMTL